MKTKKILSFALAMLMGVPLFAGCEKQDTPPEPSVTFTDVWTEGVSKTFSAGESYTVRFDAAFGGQNYIKLEYTSACGIGRDMHLRARAAKSTASAFSSLKTIPSFGRSSIIIMKIISIRRLNPSISSACIKAARSN